MENKSVICPYCGREFKNYNGLATHVLSFKKHGEKTREELLADTFYGGKRPKCKCGCGRETEIDWNGSPHYRDYVWGHASRVHNNWGHNDKAKDKSADTRRKRFKSGEIEIWNKGKKWSETYTEEEIEKLKKVYKNKERNRKISKGNKGVPKSEEHKKHLSESMSTDKNKAFFSKQMSDRINSGKFTISSKLEEGFIKDFIVPLGLEFKKQYYIKDIHQYCDVYIPSKNLVIECDGDFWHSNPKMFPNGPIYSYQKVKVEKDSIKNAYLKENGYKICRIWEDDIKNNKEKVQKILEEHTR